MSTTSIPQSFATRIPPVSAETTISLPPVRGTFTQHQPALTATVSVRSLHTTPHAHMLAEALRLAALGVYVVPLHAPLFNDAGERTGCTCEAHKRSPHYQQWLTDRGQAHKFNPEFNCRTPGKHPRVSDWETQATTDPGIIRGWFAKWGGVNLGVAPGKSGLLVLDADSYRDNYAGLDLLSPSDQQTATTITGNGGQHLYFQMPVGANYGNANNTLPEGIDIRGHGGMVVVYPSVHPSGRQYQWEDGYDLAECPPRPLPASLVALLDAAQATGKSPRSVRFTTPATTTPTTAAPELGQWHLSTATLDRIFNPAPVGQRSENDMSAITALVYAGATDDQILGVFEHCPIGVQGKFADAGHAYLARTIDRARTFAAANPRPDVQATVEAVRLWIRTHSFGALVPAELQTHRIDRSTGETTIVYMTDATDTRVADAVLGVMLDAGRLAVDIGKKRLGALAGVGPNTAVNALGRLGFLFTVTQGGHGAHVALVDPCRLAQMDPYLTTTQCDHRGPSEPNDKTTGVNGVRIESAGNEYSARKNADPFLAGTSRHVKKEITAAAAVLEISYVSALDIFAFKSLGEGGLRIIDAMLRVGADMTIAEMADETGKRPASLRKSCQRLLQHNLVDATREGSTGPTSYSVPADVWDRLAGVAPHLRSYKMSDQREDKRLEAAQQWTQHEITAATVAGEVELSVKLERRFAKQATARIPRLESLHPALSAQEIERLAYEVAAYKRSPDREAVVRTARQMAQDDHTLRVLTIVNCLTNHATQTGRLPALPVLADDGTRVQMMTIEGQMFEVAMVADVLRNPALVARTMHGVEEIYTLAR